MFSKLLVKKFIPLYDNTHDPQVKSRYAYLEGIISVYLNIFLFIINLIAGLLSGSIALITDSFHTLSDVLGSAVIIISAKLMIKPENKDHPFGHGRSDQIATIIIAVLLGVAGFEFLKSSIERIITPTPLSMNWFVIGTVVLTIILKEWNARFASYLGKKIQSEMLMASAKHHRSDAWSSLVVLIALAGYYINFPILDGIIGIVLSLMLFHAAYEIIIQGSKEILGKAPETEELQKITQEALKINGVLGVHDIILHNYGSKKIGSCHIELSSSHSLDQAHTLAEEVEDHILKSLRIHLTVHLDPTDISNPMVLEVSNKIAEIINKNPFKIRRFHDVRLVNSNESYNLVFDVSQSELISDDEKNAMNQTFKNEIQKFFPQIQKVSIQIEPLFSY